MGCYEKLVERPDGDYDVIRVEQNGGVDGEETHVRILPLADKDYPNGRPVPEEEEGFNRSIRNGYLEASDWTQIPDNEMSSSLRAEWLAYRSALRGIPSHANWPLLEADDWPTKPE